MIIRNVLHIFADLIVVLGLVTVVMIACKTPEGEPLPPESIESEAEDYAGTVALQLLAFEVSPEELLLVADALERAGEFHFDTSAVGLAEMLTTLGIDDPQVLAASAAAHTSLKKSGVWQLFRVESGQSAGAYVVSQQLAAALRGAAIGIRRAAHLAIGRRQLQEPPLLGTFGE